MSTERPRHIAIVLGLAAAVLLFGAGEALASKDFAETTEQNCTGCHDKPGSKLLTDKGKYFEEMRTLDGYAAIKGAFGECTACHSRKPGSTDLTPYGQRLSWLARDMQELRTWVLAQHPEGLSEPGELATED